MLDQLLGLLLIMVPLTLAQRCNPPPYHVNPQSCCNHPKFVDDQVFMRCFNDFSRRHRRQAGFQSAGRPGPSPQHCIGECVFQTIDLMAQGEVNMDSANNFIKSSLAGTPEWIPIVAEGFAKCHTDTKEINKVYHQTGAGDNSCNPTPGYILACLHSHVIKSCPANVWNNSPDCNELRQFFTHCQLPPKQ